MRAKHGRTARPQPAARRATRKGTGAGTAAIPDEAAVDRVRAKLLPGDRAIAAQLIEMLTRRLGSPEAAWLWLVTVAPEFGKAPLDVIAAGNAALVLADLESRWGPNPTYA